MTADNIGKNRERIRADPMAGAMALAEMMYSSDAENDEDRKPAENVGNGFKVLASIVCGLNPFADPSFDVSALDEQQRSTLALTDGEPFKAWKRKLFDEKVEEYRSWCLCRKCHAAIELWFDSNAEQKYFNTAEIEKAKALGYEVDWPINRVGAGRNDVKLWNISYKSAAEARDALMRLIPFGASNIAPIRLTERRDIVQTISAADAETALNICKAEIKRTPSPLSHLDLLRMEEAELIWPPQNRSMTFLERLTRGDNKQWRIKCAMPYYAETSCDCPPEIWLARRKDSGVRIPEQSSPPSHGNRI